MRNTNTGVPPIWKFTGWFRNETKRFKLAVLSIGFGPTVVSMVWEKLLAKPLHLSKEWQDVVPYLANLAVITFACWLIQRNKARYPGNWEIDAGTRIAVELSANRFRTWWLRVWISWVALYLLYIVFSIPVFPKPAGSASTPPAAVVPPAQSVGKAAQPTQAGTSEAVGHSTRRTLGDYKIPKIIRTTLQNTFGSLNTLFFLGCYFTLLRFYRPSIDRHSPEKPDLPTAEMISLFLVFLAADIILGVLKLFDDQGSIGLRAYSFLLEVAYGMIAAVVFALFVGRIESRYINVPLPALLGLYLYAVLQVCLATIDAAYQHLSLSDEIKIYLYYATAGGYLCASVLKGLFFLIIHWLITCGGLLYYLQMMIQADGDKHDVKRTDLITAIHHARSKHLPE